MECRAAGAAFELVQFLHRLNLYLTHLPYKCCLYDERQL